MALVSLTPAQPRPDPGRATGERPVRPGRPMRVVDPDARARLEALVPKLAGTVSGLGNGGPGGGGLGGGGSTGGVLTGGVLAGERMVPVVEALSAVLPHGLQQGSTVACLGGAATSAALLVVAEASQRGAWVGVAGLAGLGVQAAEEAGVEVERLVAVRQRTGTNVSPHEQAGQIMDDGLWGQVLAAMIDGFDLVLVGPDVSVRAATGRRVQARAQARGAVVVFAGEVPGFTADLQVRTEARWEGLGVGHGHLQARRLMVEVQGRRVPRPRRDELWCPAADGRIIRVESHPMPHPMPHPESHPGSATITPSQPAIISRAG